MKVMYSIENFVGFTEMNFGRTLVVSFQLPPLGFGDQGCGRKKSIIDRGRGLLWEIIYSFLNRMDSAILGNPLQSSR